MPYRRAEVKGVLKKLYLCNVFKAITLYEFNHFLNKA